MNKACVTILDVDQRSFIQVERLGYPKLLLWQCCCLLTLLLVLNVISRLNSTRRQTISSERLVLRVHVQRHLATTAPICKANAKRLVDPCSHRTSHWRYMRGKLRVRLARIGPAAYRLRQAALNGVRSQRPVTRVYGQLHKCIMATKRRQMVVADTRSMGWN